MPWPQTGATICTVSTSRQRLVPYYAVWLGSMIYMMGLWTSARCVGLVLCCGQDGEQAQVPQHPIDTCRFNTNGY